MTLETARANIGRKVVYRAPELPPDEPGEEGVIASANDTYVFVRYGTSVTSIATPAERLAFIS